MGAEAVFLISAAAVLGLIFGSFGTAVAHRLPRGEKIAGRSRSTCPSCGRAITAAENVPVFSYLMLRGRCRGCGEKISLRYPLAELATAVLFAVAAWKFGFSVEAVAFAGLFWALVVLTVIDLEHHLLPNKIVYPTFLVGWLLLTADALLDRAPGRLVDAGLGALVFGGFFFLVAFVYPAGMGGGDIKLGFVLGTFLGYAGGVGVVAVGMFLSFVMGAIGGVAAIKIAGGDRKMQVPFGPFLAAGAVVAIFAGRYVLDAYLGTF